MRFANTRAPSPGASTTSKPFNQEGRAATSRLVRSNSCSSQPGSVSTVVLLWFRVEREPHHHTTIRTHIHRQLRVLLRLREPQRNEIHRRLTPQRVIRMLRRVHIPILTHPNHHRLIPRSPNRSQRQPRIVQDLLADQVPQRRNLRAPTATLMAFSEELFRTRSICVGEAEGWVAAFEGVRSTRFAVASCAGACALGGEVRHGWAVLASRGTRGRGGVRRLQAALGGGSRYRASSGL
jgi:hypothetical protein